MPAPSIDHIFVALAHPLRRSLLESLSLGDKPVNELARAHPVSRPAISQHLKILLDAGLIEAHREGRTNRYALRPQQLADAYHWIGQYEHFWTDRMSRLATYLDRPGNPDPRRTQRSKP